MTFAARRLSILPILPILPILLGALCGPGLAGWAQAVPGATPAQVAVQADRKQDQGKETQRALPDIPTLMHEVEVHEKASEAIEKDYLYRSVVTEQESDGHGGVKKTTTREYDVFWVEGAQIHRLTKKDGRELSAGERKKADERADREVAKAKARREKAAREGRETDSRGKEEIAVSRFLELGSFTNPRRVKLNGRDTIAVDYTGNPKARTRNRAESVIRDLVGTLWVDEEDHALVKVEGHFVNSFRVGLGMVASIQKGTSFGMEQRKVNGEVWLPALWEGHGAARFFVFFNFNGSVRGVQSDYRKFKATSTILPGMSVPKTE